MGLPFHPTTSVYMLQEGGEQKSMYLKLPPERKSVRFRTTRTIRWARFQRCVYRRYGAKQRWQPLVCRRPDWLPAWWWWTPRSLQVIHNVPAAIRLESPYHRMARWPMWPTSVCLNTNLPQQPGQRKPEETGWSRSRCRRMDQRRCAKGT